MIKPNKCDRCGKEKESNHYAEPSAENLPYGWCYVTIASCGCEDSSMVEHKKTYVICDTCKNICKEMIDMVVG